MTVQHLEILVEELSIKEFLEVLLPRLLPEGSSFYIHPFGGKPDLLKKLLPRLRDYKQWLPSDWRLVVMVDQNGEDCRKLKKNLEQTATKSGLVSRTQAGERTWQVVNRIVIEELEAWYFGDWEAVRKAYPRVSAYVPRQARYRDPDGINRTWEALERLLQRHGYFTTGLRKTEVARAVAAHFDPARNRSHSFKVFLDATWKR